MTAGPTSRTAPLPAVMNNGDGLRPGQPGHCRGSVTRTGARGLCRGRCHTPWLSARITQYA
jgi:hypothetical protein